MKLKIILISILIILMTIISIKSSSALVRINEIMYNPVGSDNNNEYVEIYFDENINFSYYFIGDFVNNDTLKLINNIKNNNKNKFILIVEENFDYNNVNCPVYSAGKNIGNGLGNKGDVIFLFDENNKIIDKVTYTNNYANGNGKSLSLVNGFWTEQEPSPCEENFVNVDDFNNISLNNENNNKINNNKNNNKNNTDIKIGVNIQVKDSNTQNPLNPITSDIIFESKKVKMTRFIPYIIITILLMISIILIWRR